jgi:hypothetical protein
MRQIYSESISGRCKSHTKLVGGLRAVVVVGTTEAFADEGCHNCGKGRRDKKIKCRRACTPESLADDADTLGQ